MNKICFCFVMLVIVSTIIYSQNLTASEDTTEVNSEDINIKKDSTNIDSAEDSISIDTDVKKDSSVIDSVKHSTSIEVEESKDTGTGVLNITTVPDSVFVILDDVLKGRSPIVIKDIPVGMHIIVLKKKGHFLKKATINVSAGSENEVRFELIKPATLSVSSEPAGAVVLINKEKSGTTPYSTSKLKPGKYDIMLLKEGYKKEQHTVELDNGGQDSIHVTLVPLEKVSEDTVSTVKEQKKPGKEKSKLSSILDKFALGVFIAFTLVILIIELAQND